VLGVTSRWAAPSVLLDGRTSAVELRRNTSSQRGASEELFERSRCYTRANDNQNVADLPNPIDQNQYATIWVEGRAITLEQAIQYALAAEKGE
jgi:hypothetical protein